jgi:hypothetical protein
VGIVRYKPKEKNIIKLKEYLDDKYVDRNKQPKSTNKLQIQ